MKPIEIDFKELQKERRKAQRLNIPLRTQYRLLSNEAKRGILYETFCHDISGGGLGLSVGHALQKGDKIEVMLYFPNDPKPVTVTTEVMWCRKMPANDKKPTFAAGVQYTKIKNEEKERFIMLFCQMMVDYFVLGKEKIECRRHPAKIRCTA